MQEYYDFTNIEQQAQDYWERNNSFKVKDDVDNKFYCLSMFPYPSGKIHMGHVRNYTIGDAISRFQAMQGKNVLQPMGWDAFGMPAENAAIANKVAPAKWTYNNIVDMKIQLRALGLAIDWDREVTTCKPDYYHWEQWFFVKLFKKGIIYKKTGIVNWDPVDQTVLANEQVIEGRGWRSGALVEKREIPMYYFKITDYAQELLDGLDTLDGWPAQVKTMQRNWIGKSRGLNIVFTCEHMDCAELSVFTARPDTLMGVTYIAVAPEHELAIKAAQNNSEIQRFISEESVGSVSEAEFATKDKKGIFSGFYAKHPITHQDIPIWIASYVLINYGSGAVMAVPAHDKRDFEFANKYSLPIWQVVRTQDPYDCKNWHSDYSEKNTLINSQEFDGLGFEEAFEKFKAILVESNLGSEETKFRLRDWGISRQRYWGCPIPIIHCESCGDVPVPTAQLPVVLPENLIPEIGNPLNKCVEFTHTSCPICKKDARRETDTMDTFVESSWYFARYASPNYNDGMLDTKGANHLLPVDQYIGGIEHAVLHLLYARFFHKLMRDEGLVSSDEPFVKLLTQGMVVAETYYRQADNGKKEWFNPADINFEFDAKGKPIKAILRKDALPVEIGNIEKMSKSKNNGIDPAYMIKRYGADTCRLFMMFASPPDMSLEWSDDGIEGAHRFLKRVYRIVHKHMHSSHFTVATTKEIDINILSAKQKEVRFVVHSSILRASEDIIKHNKFNTPIAQVMSIMNLLEKLDANNEQDSILLHEGIRTTLLLLSPIAPHITHVLWQQLGNDKPIHKESWPQADIRAVNQDNINIVVQISGKKRAEILVPQNISKEELEQLVIKHADLNKYLLDSEIKKIIYVPKKLVNIVI